MRLETLLPMTRLEVRPYQTRLVKKVRKMFDGQYVNGAGNVETAAKSIIMEAPTGAGKTPCLLLQARLEQELHGSLVVWTTMRRNLLAQAARENAPPSLGNPRGKNIGAQVSFLSMFTREIPEELLPAHRDRPLLLIVDEVQHDGANTMAHMHNELRADRVLGASATPWRSDKVKLCFEKVVRDIGIRELIQQGWLSQYDHFSIPNWDPETVADFYARDPARWGASLVFFHQQHLCRRFHHRLTGYHGIPSDIVTGNSDREQQTRDLAEGRVACLANCAVLTEGFDLPSLKTCWIRDSTKSCVTQMGGRVFRKHADIPVKQIVQSKLTPWPFLKTAMPIMQYVWENGEWLSLTINPLMNQVSMNSRYMIAHSETYMPEFIRRHTNKKRRRNRF